MKHNIEQIVEYANKFRKAIEQACHDGKFNDRMRSFPNGCCDDASELFAAFLLEKGICSTEVTGFYDTGDANISTNHTWLEIDSYIIDLTADQFFGKGLYYGSYTDFYYSMKSVERDIPFDIRKHKNLSNDYRIILSYLAIGY